MMGETLVESKSLHVPGAYGELPNGWRWSRLDEICEGVFDCPHSTPELTNIGPFVVRTQDIISGVFRTHEAAHVSEETYKERTARVTPILGDLLYSREGTYFGIAAEVPAKTRVCLGQRMVLIRPNKKELDFGYLRYWLNSPIMAAHIHGYRDGTVAERLNLPTIRALPVLIPPLAAQKTIASILGALDDKIELNRRMNATLEAMARALFQSWFVDFDPVRAKLDGRKPVGMDDETAALFPDSFQETVLGHIPEGWQIKPLGDVIELAYGKPLKAEDRKSGPIVVCGANGPVGFHNEMLVAGPGIVVGRKGNPGVVTWMNNDFYPIDTTFYVVPNGLCRSLYFLFYSLSLHNLGNLSADSAVPGLNRNHAYMSKQIVPSPKVLDAFDLKVSPIFSAMHANDQQSITLAKLRDTLLPKLLSGELNVPLASKDLENVISLPVTEAVGKKKVSNEFVEAIVISQLVRKLASDKHPLGRMRYNKLAYLAHRKVEDDVTQQYLKKAAGPYSPWAKYGGPEAIAIKNSYIKKVKVDNAEGFVVGSSIDKIDAYLSHYPVCGAIDWVIDKFRYKKNEELELLATVDFAAVEIRSANKAVTKATIRKVIAENREWAPKLNREVFSGSNIDRALIELSEYFPSMYGR